ncbi:MAG: ABC transporter permease [Bdellovibrionaceae bacterium]|nr:ABC transporter permease [Pseudobdellovibrionaceae bacterium]
MNERRRVKAPWFARAVLILVLLALYGPLLVLVAGSFLESTATGLVVTGRWFIEVFADTVLGGALLNSLIVAFCSAVCATVLGTGAAIALHRGPFPGRQVLRGLSFVSLALPEIVFALALLSWFFLLHWHLSLVTVIAAHITFSLSYVILTVSARLSTMDQSLEDAARDLGAGEWHLLRRVILPLLKPSLIAAFLLSFLLSFDDFLITFFVNGVGRDTLPIKLYTSMKMGLTPKLNALATLMWLGSALLIILAFRSPGFRDVLKAGEDKPGENE